MVLYVVNLIECLVKVNFVVLISIGNNVWVGVGVIIFVGIKVVDNLVIGVGVIVIKDVVVNILVVGNFVVKVKEF